MTVVCCGNFTLFTATAVGILTDSQRLSLFWSNSKKTPLLFLLLQGRSQGIHDRSVVRRLCWWKWVTEVLCAVPQLALAQAFTAPCPPLECPLWDIFWDFPWATFLFTQQMRIFCQQSVLYTFWHLTYTWHAQSSCMIHCTNTARKDRDIDVDIDKDTYIDIIYIYTYALYCFSKVSDHYIITERLLQTGLVSCASFHTFITIFTGKMDCF